jgi:hypothetical protein
MGKIEPVFQYLFKAIELGHLSKQEYELDGDLPPLRNTPQWAVLLQKLE